MEVVSRGWAFLTHHAPVIYMQYPYSHIVMLSLPDELAGGAALSSDPGRVQLRSRKEGEAT